MLRYLKNKAQDEKMGIKPRGALSKLAYAMISYFIFLKVANYFGYLATWTIYPMAIPAAITFSFVSMLLGTYYLKKGLKISNKILKYKTFSKNHKHRRSEKSRRI
ncbi:hypothetical protein PCYB_033070 [Plasmodium cynomolgi strain B]|uniref:Uncharacterized protein n=1 Tax=Plasmodium cynomolgi (strain B) TaxID=1120755 RepID=K6UCI2_PLACD|nr:hypothetical protein PCYB_033070 [Plasmodium cynomolgi strain B]GAB64896.1 hypothetical protein PCYB_033070 [Plasmodium cynomolgi strain B]